MSRNGRRTGKLGVGVHTAHGVGHAVRGGAGRHVVGVQGTAGAAAGGNREVVEVVFHAPFLIGARNGMLEPGGVGGVAGDGNADFLQLHDGNAFGNVIRAIAFYICTGAVGEGFLADNFDFLGVGVKLGFHIGEAVDAGNDISRVFAQAVQDNPQGFFPDFVGVQGDFDSAFRSREGLVAS